MPEFNVDDLPDLTSQQNKKFNVDDLPDLKKKEEPKLKTTSSGSTSSNTKSSSVSQSSSVNPYYVDITDKSKSSNTVSKPTFTPIVDKPLFKKDINVKSASEELKLINAKNKVNTKSGTQNTQLTNYNEIINTGIKGTPMDNTYMPLSKPIVEKQSQTLVKQATEQNKVQQQAKSDKHQNILAIMPELGQAKNKDEALGMMIKSDMKNHVDMWQQFDDNALLNKSEYELNDFLVSNGFKDKTREQYLKEQAQSNPKYAYEYEYNQIGSLFKAVKQRADDYDYVLKSKFGDNYMQEAKDNNPNILGDEDFNKYLSLREKENSLSTKANGLIYDSRFKDVKKQQDDNVLAQQKSDYLAKEDKWYKFSDESRYLKNKAAYAAGHVVKLVAEIPSIATSTNTGYDVTDKIADWGNRFSENLVNSVPVSSDLQNGFNYEVVKVDGYKVILDDNKNPVKIVDNNNFNVSQQVSDKILNQYNDNKENYEIHNEYSSRSLVDNGLNTMIDMGIMILGTKGAGMLGAGKNTAKLVSMGIGYMQTKRDTFNDAIKKGLDPKDADILSNIVGIAAGTSSIINPMEYNIATGNGIMGLIKKEGFDASKLALIREGRLSVKEYAKEFIKEATKNALKENIEEVGIENTVQGLSNNYFNNKISETDKIDGGLDTGLHWTDKQGIETLLVTAGTAILLTPLEINSQTNLNQQEALKTAFENPEQFEQVRKLQLQQGYITQEQYDNERKIYDNVSRVYNASKEEVSEKEQPYLLALLTKKYNLSYNIDRIKDDTVSKKYKDMLNMVNASIDNVMKGEVPDNNIVETNDNKTIEQTQQNTTYGSTTTTDNSSISTKIDVEIANKINQHGLESLTNNEKDYYENDKENIDKLIAGIKVNGGNDYTTQTNTGSDNQVNTKSNVQTTNDNNTSQSEQTKSDNTISETTSNTQNTALTNEDKKSIISNLDKAQIKEFMALKTNTERNQFLLNIKQNEQSNKSTSTVPANTESGQDNGTTVQTASTNDTRLGTGNEQSVRTNTKEIQQNDKGLQEKIDNLKNVISELENNPNSPFHKLVNLDEQKAKLAELEKQQPKTETPNVENKKADTTQKVQSIKEEKADIERRKQALRDLMEATGDDIFVLGTEDGTFAGEGLLNMNENGDVVLTRHADSKEGLTKGKGKTENLANIAGQFGGEQIATSGIEGGLQSFTNGFVGEYHIPLNELMQLIKDGYVVFAGLGNKEFVLSPHIADKYLTKINGKKINAKYDAELEKQQQKEITPNIETKLTEQSINVEQRTQNGITKYDANESEAEALKRLTQGISELPKEQQTAEIEKRAKEHAIAYEQYLENNPISQDQKALQRVSKFEEQTAKAMQNIIDNPTKWESKTDKSFENGSRLDENGDAMPENEYISLKERVKELRKQGNLDEIQKINKAPKKYYDSNIKNNSKLENKNSPNGNKQQSEQLDIFRDTAENEHANSKLTGESEIEQKANVDTIRSKAESNNETKLNEAINESTDLINKALDIERKPISEIHTDEARFQGRNKLNQTIVNNIANNFSEADQDPIHIWKDPKDNKYYVLSGHHRYYGAKKSGKTDIKVVDRTNDFTEEQAIKFAKEEANANRSMETPLERAKTLRQKRERGDTKEDIDKFLELEGRNKVTINNLSHLNPQGKTMQMLEQMQDSTDKTQQNEIEKIADWIGQIRRLNKKITNQHEEELLNFLLDKESSKRFRTKDDFISKVSSITNTLDFNSDNPLNIARYKYTSDGEKQYDHEVETKKNKIKELQNKIDDIKDRFTNPNNPNYVKAENTDYDTIKSQADKIIAETNTQINAEQKALQELYQQKGKYTNAGSNQGALFQSQGITTTPTGERRFKKISAKRFNKLIQKLKNAFPNIKINTFTDTEKILGKSWNEIKNLAEKAQFAMRTSDKWDNSGYTEREDGTKVSVRGLDAERNGTFTELMFRNKYNISKTDFKILLNLGFIEQNEWHHTGKGFKQSDYFSWADSERVGGNIEYSEDGTNNNDSDSIKPLSELYQENKKEISKLTKDFDKLDYNFKHKKKEIGIPTLDMYLGDNTEDGKLTEKEINSKYREHEHISNDLIETHTGYERMLLHQKVDNEYDAIIKQRKQEIINKVKPELEKKYNEQYAKEIAQNEQIKKYNNSLKEQNSNLTEKGKEGVMIAVAKILGIDADNAYNKVNNLSRIDAENKASANRVNYIKQLEQKRSQKVADLKNEFNEWIAQQKSSGNITSFNRQTKVPDLSITTYSEMNGKYGWFESSSIYNLTKYYSGFTFKNEDVKRAYAAKQDEIYKAEFESLENFKFLRTQQGTIYGFVKDGQIYLNENELNANTPIHEMGHIWAQIAKQQFPSIHKNIIEKIKQVAHLMDIVRNDNAYSHIKDNEDAIADEVLAKLIGNKGEEDFMAMLDAKEKTLFQQILEHIKYLWNNKIKPLLGAQSPNIRKWTDKQFMNATYKDIVDNITSEILSDRIISRMSSEELTNNDSNTKLSYIGENAENETEQIKSKATADGTFMKAPNGNPTNLDEKQWLQVHTKAFKDWFGDWENDPQNASKVVDENGEPLVVYHTTNDDFNKFDKRKSREGFYFAPNKERLSVYNKSKTIPFFLNIKNPSSEVFKRNPKELSPKGYDGVMDFGLSDNRKNESLYEIIAFEPNQIKSATDNVGTFDPNNNDIRFQAEEPTDKGILDDLKTLKDKDLSDTEIRDVLDFMGYSKQDIDIALGGKEVFGIKKALVPEQVIENVNIDKLTHKQIFDIGKNNVDNDAINPKQIVDDVLDGNITVLDANQVGSLIYYRAQLANRITELSNKIKEAEPNTGEYNVLKKQYDLALQEQDNYHEMAVRTAYNQSIAFSMRKLLIDDEYTAQKQISIYKQVNNGTISSEKEQEFKKLAQKYKEASDRIAELEQEKAKWNAQNEIELTIEKSKKISKQNSDRKKTGRDLVAQGLDEIAQLLGGIKFASGDNMPQLTKALSKIGRGLIEIGSATVDDVFDKIKTTIKDKFGDKINLDSLKESVINEIKSQYKKATVNKKGELSFSMGLIRSLILNGYNTVDTLTNKLREIAKDQFPDISDRQIHDAITRYGNSENQSKDDIDKEMYKLKRIMLLMSKVEDAQAGKRPLKTGVIRDEATDEERTLQKQLNELLKDIPLDDTENDKRLKTALESVKTRLRNQIKDLEAQIEQGKSEAKKKGIEYDDEANGLVELRDALKKELEDKYGKGGMSDEQRLKMALKQVKKAIDNYEQRINNKDFTQKDKSTTPSSEELTQAKQRLNTLKDEYTKMYKESKEYEAKQLENKKKAVRKRIEELKTKIENKDFTPTHKKASPFDDELGELNNEKLRQMSAFQKEQELNRIENRTKLEKAKDAIIGILNIPRMLKTTIDMSAPFRQGIRLMAGHPIEFTKAFIRMHKLAFSQKDYDDFMDKFRSSDAFPIIKTSGLSITDVTGIQKAREEQFWNNIISNVLENKTVNKYTFGIPKVADNYTFKASERAYSGFLDMLRINVFMSAVDVMQNNGITIENNKEAYKQLAYYVNSSTGRGDMGGVGQDAQSFLNTFFFSAKFMKSLYDYTKSFARASTGIGNELPPEIRKMIVKDFISFFAVNTILVGLGQLAVRALGGDDERKLETDGRSSDFMKIVKGDTRYEFWSGFQPAVRTAIQYATGEQKSVTTGNITELGSNMFTPTRNDKIIDFFGNKLSPLASYVYKWGKGTQFGKPFDAKGEAKNLFIPMSISGISQDIANNDKASKIIIDAILNNYGVSVQNFNNNDKKEVSKDDTKSNKHRLKRFKRDKNTVEQK